MKLPFILLMGSMVAAGQASKDHDEFAYVRHEINPSHSIHPKNGLVPDADTAIAIAYAVAVPVYGREEIDTEKPLRAEFEQGKWIVLGTLHGKTSGGTLMVQIEQSTGAISFLGHSV